LALGGVLFLAFLPSTRADDTEQRSFTIQVDSRPAGDCRMTITRQDDGAEVMAAQVNVRIRFLIMYRFTYRGTEEWKGGRLQSLRSSCDDNGQRFEVSALADGDRLAILVNGKERKLSADVWTTSYWKLPDARFHNQPVTLIDPDRGTDLARQLRYVGPEDLIVAGQTQKCYHFRVTGGPAPVELWFDVQHRLVRQDFVEQGHRTVVQLVSVRR
jgi:hypothetical protein